VTLWGAEERTELRELQGDDEWLKGVKYSPNGRQIATWSVGNAVKIWDADTGLELCHLHGHVAPVETLAFSQDCQWIATGSNDSTVRIWQSRTGIQSHCLRGHESTVRQLVYSPEGDLLVSSSLDNTVRIWDTRSGIELRCIEPLENAEEDDSSPTRAARRSDSDTVMTVGCPGDLLDASVLRSEYHRRPFPTSMSFRHDGQRIAIAWTDGTIRIWSTRTWEELCCITGHNKGVLSVTYSPDGREVASGSEDHTVRIWDAETGAELRRLRGHEYTVFLVAFSSDGRRLVSGSHDNTTRVWNADSGICIDTIEGRGDVVGIARASGSHRCWRAFISRLETTIEPSRFGESISRFPVAFNELASHPNGVSWAGVSGNHLYIVTLEGGK
jgi:WD40 repeat protein